MLHPFIPPQPDGDSFMDRLPNHPNIVVGCGFSGQKEQSFILLDFQYFRFSKFFHTYTGQGFKLAPVVGQILAELALNMEPTHDITPFKISRFTSLRSSL